MSAVGLLSLAVQGVPDGTGLSLLLNGLGQATGATVVLLPAFGRWQLRRRSVVLMLLPPDAEVRPARRWVTVLAALLAVALVGGLVASAVLGGFGSALTGFGVYLAIFQFNSNRWYSQVERAAGGTVMRPVDGRRARREGRQGFYVLRAPAVTVGAPAPPPTKAPVARRRAPYADLTSG